MRMTSSSPTGWASRTKSWPPARRRLNVIAVEVDPPHVAGGVVILHAPARIGERLQALQHFDEGGEEFLGNSPPMHALKARAAQVAAMEAPLLIVGETGTEKELVAHACHRASARNGKPFLALNCAVLPENLALRSHNAMSRADWARTVGPPRPP